MTVSVYMSERSTVRLRNRKPHPRESSNIRPYLEPELLRKYPKISRTCSPVAFLGMMKSRLLKK